MRKRIVTKYGNTFVIRLTSYDMRDLELQVGDYVDIDDISKINNANKIGGVK